MAKASEIDFLVMDAGVAGLRAAIELARHGEVLVVTKESLSESNTHYAQGGIATESLPLREVVAVVGLLDDGGTVRFMSRQARAPVE